MTVGEFSHKEVTEEERLQSCMLLSMLIYEAEVTLDWLEKCIVSIGHNLYAVAESCKKTNSWA